MTFSGDILRYVAWAAAVFLLWSAINQRRNLIWSQLAVRIVFAVLILYSTLVRTVVYHAGVTPAPRWHLPVSDGLFIVLCILLILNAYQLRRKQ